MCSVAHPIRIYNAIILWALKLCLFWPFLGRNLKTQPLGTLIEYLALGNPIQMILFFCCSDQDLEVLRWLRAIPAPPLVSCYTITQYPGANSPNTHNPSGSLLCCLCIFLCDCTTCRKTCCRGLLFSSQCEALKDISGLWQKPLLLSEILWCMFTAVSQEQSHQMRRCKLHTVKHLIKENMHARTTLQQ